jgi:hypothetical protein
LFLTSVIAAAAITFTLLGKKTVDSIDISHTWYVDYNEKSDDIFIVLKKADKYKAM